MDHCKDFIKTEFPSIDIEMFQYIEGNILRIYAHTICPEYLKFLSVIVNFLRSVHIYICKYCFMVTGVLQNGIEDFHDSEDIFEAIGEVLQEIANKSESDIRYNIEKQNNDNI